EGDDCHACQASLSVMNFGPNNQRIGYLQHNFTQIGSWGKAPARKDENVATHDLKNGSKLLLVDDSYSAQGDVVIGKLALFYDAEKFSWSDLGFIQTAGSGESYKWSGVIDVRENSDGVWPDLLVTAEGTDFEAPAGSVVPVPKTIRYKYNGKTYGRV